MNELDRQRRKVQGEAAGRNGAAAKRGARPADGAPTASEPPGLQTTALTEVRPEPVRFLVEGYLPLGKLVLIAGDGGHGKSSLTLHLIAALSRGQAAFGLQYEPPPPADALLISCEDDFADTVVPRLLAAGADLARVFRVDGVRIKGDKPAPFSLAHYKQLEAELQARPNVRLVVIDPAGAYVGNAGIDDYKDSELRSLLGPLAELAARRRVTMLAVKHVVKGTAAKAVHRVTGSAAYVNTVRAAFVVCPDKEDDKRKLFLPLKFNLGSKPPGLSYRIEGLSADEQAAVLAPFTDLEPADRLRLGGQLIRIRWEGVADIDADAAMSADAGRRERDPNKVEKATAWLADFLQEHAYPSDEILAGGKAAGFTFDNIKEAKARLKAEKGLRHSNRGRFAGVWWSGFGDPDAWRLRPTPDAPHSPHSPPNEETGPQTNGKTHSGESGESGEGGPASDGNATPPPRLTGGLKPLRATSSPRVASGEADDAEVIRRNPFLRPAQNGRD